MKALANSYRRIRTIALNTLREALRQRALLVVVLFGIVMIFSADFFTRFAFFEELKFLKDIGHAAISWTGLLVALISTAQLIPAEIERRTIYTVMSRPVLPLEYVLGKYLGLLSVVTILVFLMSVIFAGVLIYKERQLITKVLPPDPQNPSALVHDPAKWSPEIRQHVEEIRAQARDTRLLQAVMLVWCMLAVVAAIALMLSTVASSTTFIVGCTVMLYLAGCMLPAAREYILGNPDEVTAAQVYALGIISWIIPDMSNYSIIDEIIAGNPVRWAQSTAVAAYSMVYCFVLLVLGSLVFESREL